MNHDDLLHWSKHAADWAHKYHTTLRTRPVRAPLNKGASAALLSKSPPNDPEPMSEIFADFERIVPAGMTHWQHPRFFAYFPANAAPASMLAEQLCNAIAAQGMIWQSAPVATEMEEVMMSWLAQALGLPAHFNGTIHDSATTATLSAVLTMREAALNWQGLSAGLSGQKRLRLYTSAQAHSSVDKATRIAGIGQDNLVKIPTNPNFSINVDLLEQSILTDQAAGHLPIGLILVMGGTSIGAMDDIAAAQKIAAKYNMPVHVDAAWAGSAMICPEFRPLWGGIDAVQSIVFNPHKWLGAQFDCAVQFIADPAQQIRTLGLRPSYLQTQGAHEPVNFNEWTVPLGRRFRALKLWFLVRAYGITGLQALIRNHVRWAQELCAMIEGLGPYHITSHPRLSLFSFAHEQGDQATADLLERINNEGRIYLTQTQHEGRFVIRVQVGQFDCTRDDVMMIAQVLRDFART